MSDPGRDFGTFHQQDKVTHDDHPMNDFPEYPSHDSGVIPTGLSDHKQLYRRSTTENATPESMIVRSVEPRSPSLDPKFGYGDAQSFSPIFGKVLSPVGPQSNHQQPLREIERLSLGSKRPLPPASESANPLIPRSDSPAKMTRTSVEGFKKVGTPRTTNSRRGTSGDDLRMGIVVATSPVIRATTEDDPYRALTPRARRSQASSMSATTKIAGIFRSPSKDWAADLFAKDARFTNPLIRSTDNVNGVIAKKMAIQAVYDFRRGNSPESRDYMEFNKGDIFDVIRQVSEARCFEVFDRSSGRKGLVPYHYFKEFQQSPSPFIQASVENNRNSDSPKTPQIPTAPLKHDSIFQNHLAKSPSKATPHEDQSWRNPEPPIYYSPPPSNESLQKQPESRPISQHQLAEEVKGIYAGLVIVESKCVNLVNRQTIALEELRERGQKPPDSPADDWQRLIALHRTLLHEHHDFLLASQHPSASTPIRDLAARYSMPARMWKHGIHNFLELLRNRLPSSLDYMLAFIYLAYQIMALLQETVPTFEDTWIECLGDLARYRMAIEDDDVKDRETWTGVARYWYSKAANRNPGVGRLYHHLAILCRSHPIHQLALYCRSLLTVQPFASTRDSIMTLLEPIMSRSESQGGRQLPTESFFVKVHALIFTKAPREKFEHTFFEFMLEFDSMVSQSGFRFKSLGASMAVANVCALFGYGDADAPFWKFIQTRNKPPSSSGQDHRMTNEDVDILKQDQIFGRAWLVTMSTFTLSLKRTRDSNILGLVHVTLYLIYRLLMTCPLQNGFTDDIPFTEIAVSLNSFMKDIYVDSAVELPHLTKPTTKDFQPLPEDFSLRGLVWAERYIPQAWFDSATSDEDERMMERQQTHKQRLERVIWIAVRISQLGEIPCRQQRQWLRYNAEDKIFSVKSKYATSRQARVSASTWDSANSAEADEGGPPNV